MKMKSVVLQERARNNLDELTVIENTKVYFSGSPDKFLAGCDISMISFRNHLLNKEVLSHTVIRGRKLFVFLVSNDT